MQEIFCVSAYTLCLWAVLGQIPLPVSLAGHTSLWSFSANLGLSVALVIFFVIKGDKRENRMSQRIENLEKFQEETLIRTIESSSLAIATSTHSQETFSESLSDAVESLKDVASEIASLQRTLEARPCIARDRTRDRTDPRQAMET